MSSNVVEESTPAENISKRVAEGRPTAIELGSPVDPPTLTFRSIEEDENFDSTDKGLNYDSDGVAPSVRKSLGLSSY